MSRHLKFVMTKLRFGVANISTHNNRYKAVQDNDLLCPLCKETTEDDAHFVLLLCCPFFDNLRQELMAEQFYRNPNSFRFSSLITSTQENTIRNLCVFIIRSFKAKEIAIT